jgi:hypothetical protein
LKKLLALVCLIPFFGTSQIKHIDPVQNKTIGTAWAGPEKIAWLQERQVDGRTFYFLVYEDFFNGSARGIKEIKFTGGQSVLNELYKTLQDAIAKRKGGETSFKLGDEVLSMEVKTSLRKKYLDISADGGGFQLKERQINKLFGK